MTYEEAQLIIDDETQQDAIAKSLRGLNSLAKKLKAKRFENGYEKISNTCNFSSSPAIVVK